MSCGLSAPLASGQSAGLGIDLKKINPFRPNNDHYEHFAAPVLIQSALISADLVPGPFPRINRKKY
jgi:hypothetical protein